MWNLMGDVELIDLGYGYYVAKFDNQEDRNKVMTGGTWMLVQRKFRKSTAKKGKQQLNNRDHDSNNRYVALDSLENMEEEISLVMDGR